MVQYDKLPAGQVGGRLRQSCARKARQPAKAESARMSARRKAFGSLSPQRSPCCGH
jgi:hypothetical protein